MTETIEAPAAVKPIHHWIGGAVYAGQSGRSGPVYNPATGQRSGGSQRPGSSASSSSVESTSVTLPFSS